MATQADIQRWTQTVYQQQYSLSTALSSHVLAPTNLTKNEKQLEVQLFCAMMDYFWFHPAQFAAIISTEETHHHYVYPQNIPGYCEISDVLFIVFSRRNNLLRMTHMQAKRKKITDVMPLSISRITNFEFPIDAIQYSLLNGRLPFTNRGQSQYPIATFCHPEFSDSIASYGVFYLTPNNMWHLAYEVAPIVRRNGGKGEFCTTKNIYDYLNSLWMYKYQHQGEWVLDYTNQQPYPTDELVSTLDTVVFEHELINCHVGSKIKRGDIVGEEIIAYISRLFGYIYNDLSQHQQSIVGSFREYVKGEHNEQRDIPIDENLFPGSIVLIDADKSIEIE